MTTEDLDWHIKQHALTKVELAKAHEPFTEDTDERIEVYKNDSWYAYRIEGGGDTSPFRTWREAYRAAEHALCFQELAEAKRRIVELSNIIECDGYSQAAGEMERANTPVVGQGVATFTGTSLDQPKRPLLADHELEALVTYMDWMLTINSAVSEKEAIEARKLLVGP